MLRRLDTSDLPYTAEGGPLPEVVLHVGGEAHAGLQLSQLDLLLPGLGGALPGRHAGHLPRHLNSRVQ